jgi:hypothetical protein
MRIGTFAAPNLVYVAKNTATNQWSAFTAISSDKILSTLCIDTANILYGNSGHVVQMFTALPTYSTLSLAGSASDAYAGFGPLNSAPLSTNLGALGFAITCDSYGNIYTVDNYNGLIYQIQPIITYTYSPNINITFDPINSSTTPSEISQLANSGVTTATLALPQGAVVAPGGAYMYFIDARNGYVRKLTTKQDANNKIIGFTNITTIGSNLQETDIVRLNSAGVPYSFAGSKIYSLGEQQTALSITLTGIIQDICFDASDRLYVLLNNAENTSSSVAIISSNGGTYNTILGTPALPAVSVSIAADKNGNIFVGGASKHVYVAINQSNKWSFPSKGL